MIGMVPQRLVLFLLFSFLVNFGALMILLAEFRECFLVGILLGVTLRTGASEDWWMVAPGCDE
jgi:hypothetical protein